MFKLAPLMFAFAILTGCSDDSDPTTVDAGSQDAAQSCTTKSTCSNGACTCQNAGPNQGKSCCDPSSASCSNKPDNCTSFCLVCN